MSAIKGRVVSLSQGNVYRCEFGRAEAAGAEPQESDVHVVVAEIRSEVAEINTLIREISGTNDATTEQSAVNSQTLLDAIAKLDSIAFQSNLLAHGLSRGIAGNGLELVAIDVQHFVGEGAGVVRRLRALVSEHRNRLVNLSRALREIGEQVAVLETMTSSRVMPVSAGMPEVAEAV